MKVFCISHHFHHKCSQTNHKIQLKMYVYQLNKPQYLFTYPHTHIYIYLFIYLFILHINTFYLLQMRYSPMMIACKYGHDEIVRTILNDLQSLSDKRNAQYILRNIFMEQTEDQEEAAGRKMNCLELAICYGHK